MYVRVRFRNLPAQQGHWKTAGRTRMRKWGGEWVYGIHSPNSSEMWFLWGMSSQMFPLHPTPRPASPWIQLRPNDTSAAIITYSLTADRRKRRESVLSIPAPTHRNNPQHKTLLACLPSALLCSDHSSTKATTGWLWTNIFVNATFLSLMASVIFVKVQLHSDIKLGDSQNSRGCSSAKVAHF